MREAEVLGFTGRSGRRCLHLAAPAYRRVAIENYPPCGAQMYISCIPISITVGSFLRILYHLRGPLRVLDRVDQTIL